MDKVEQEIALLEQQLSEANAADNFFETASGKLITQLISKRITLSVDKLTSDKFLRNHKGYVTELAWLNANKRLLRELQVASAPQRVEKIKEKLKDYGRD